MTILSNSNQNQPYLGSSPANEEAAELQDTSGLAINLKRQQPDHMYGNCYTRDSLTSWGQGVLRLLESIG